MYSEATSWVYDLCIEGTMMICLEGNGARIPLRSRDMTIFEFVRQRERITLRGACVKECVKFRYIILKVSGLCSILSCHTRLITSSLYGAEIKMRKRCGKVNV